jgi:hypothetical protein
MRRNFAGSPVSQGGMKKQDGICPEFIEILVCPARIERATPSLEGWCSIQLSYGHIEIELKRAILMLETTVKLAFYIKWIPLLLRFGKYLYCPLSTSNHCCYDMVSTV